MWILIYGKDYGNHKAGELHLIGRGKFKPSNHKMEILEYVEIPNQDTSHLYQGDPPELVGSINDLRQYTPEEKKHTPVAAREALKVRGPTSNEKSVADLCERMALYEAVLGIRE